MLILTPETLDRIETVRDLVTAAIANSELSPEFTIDLRQAMNTTIDRTVGIAIDRANALVTAPTITTPPLQF